MNIVCTSGEIAYVNADLVNTFMVAPKKTEDGEDTIFVVYADGTPLSIHKEGEDADRALKEFMSAIATSKGNLLYYMEDTI